MKAKQKGQGVLELIIFPIILIAIVAWAISMIPKPALSDINFGGGAAASVATRELTWKGVSYEISVTSGKYSCDVQVTNRLTGINRWSSRQVPCSQLDPETVVNDIIKGMQGAEDGFKKLLKEIITAMLK